MNNKTPTAMQPEMEVLLYCGRNYSDPQVSVGLQPLLNNSVGWPYLLKIANAHGMLPILCKVVAASPDCVPERFRSRLQSTARRNILWALRLTKELLKVLDGLESHQVPAVAYKGPALAASAYGDIALRGFRDLDIIVQKQNMFRARDVLFAQGYESAAAPAEQTPLREDGFQQLRSAWGFVNQDNGILVDLQWKATFFSRLRSPVEQDGFWEKLEDDRLAGRTIRAIPAEALLQILCVHGSRHLWERLIWICDVAALIRSQPGLNWTQLMSEAKSQGNQRIVLIGVFLANHLLGARVPQDVLMKAQADKVVRKLAGEVCERLRSDPCRPIVPVESRSFHLRMLERSGDRLRFFQYFLGSLAAPNARDRAAVSLPPALSFLYYVIRPMRLILRYGLIPLRLPAKMFLGK